MKHLAVRGPPQTTLHQLVLESPAQAVPQGLLASTLFVADVRDELDQLGE